MVERDFPDFDVVTSDIHNGQVVSHRQRPVVSAADTLKYLKLNVRQKNESTHPEAR